MRVRVLRAQAQPGPSPPQPADPAGVEGFPTEDAGGPGPAEARDQIVRDFHDPYLELVRLAREASEVEHALMLQYLFAAFSVKPKYVGLVGWGTPSAADLLGVAVQEMQHLAEVNRLQVELEVNPSLARQDFPYEPDIYPFSMNLAPLSRYTVAQYVFAEAPAQALDPTAGKEDPEFLRALYDVLGPGVRPNHLGSLYAALIKLLGEFETLPSGQRLDTGGWSERLTAIKDEGEDAHYGFFKSVFLATHPAFEGNTLVWDDPQSTDYPALALAENPSAYLGHERQIPAQDDRAIAWLSDLQYWIVLMLLSRAYSEASPVLMDRAKRHMTGPLKALGEHLATRGVGIPFDQLSMGYSPDRDPARRAILLRLLAESQRLTTHLRDRGLLPDGYPAFIDDQTVQRVGGQ